MNTQKIKIIIIFVLIIGALTYVVTSNMHPRVLPEPVVSNVSTPTVVSGEIVCLPHINTSGPQTMECAYGIKDTEGHYYELLDIAPNNQNVSTAPMNTPVLVEGMLTLQSSDRYQSIGTIAVSKITTIAVSPTSPESGTEIIGIGETKMVGPIAITLHSVVQDSRCPADVMCIQAGAITARVTLKMGPNFETFNMPSDEVPHTFWGYKVSITDVGPARNSKYETNPKDYKVTFHVERS